MRLRYQFELIRAIRQFFVEQDFVDIMTPPMVENPGMETHIHPFEIFSAKDKKSKNLFLHTSPEFMMKELLSSDEGLENIFTLTYTFRDEPDSPHHRNQFIMLEWYRKNAHYTKIMQDTEELIRYTYEKLQAKNAPMRFKDFPIFQKATINELFLDILKIDILNFLDKKDLKLMIEKDFKDVPLPNVDLEWDDYFFLFYLNKIEPKIAKIPALLVYEFPYHLSALSTLKENDPRVCERFEVYIEGVELCNAFNEVTSKEVLEKRFQYQNQQKRNQYGYTLPSPKRFYKTMENYPPSAGIALGVERLLLSLVDIENPFWT